MAEMIGTTPKPHRTAAALLLILMLSALPWPAPAQAQKTKIPPALAQMLTDSEKQFLSSVGPIRAQSESDWAPFNFHENGVPKGYSIDYMQLLAQKVGLEVVFVHGPTWNEFLAMARRGDLDVVLNIAKSPEREEYLTFTPSYVTMVQMLYTRKDFPTVSSIKDLYGKRFAVPKGFFLESVLKEHQEITIVSVPDSSAAIRAVSTGAADAMFDLMPVVDYITATLQITNLKVGGELGLDEGKPIPLHIGVRKDLKTLADILEKGMATISQAELRTLNEKWLGGSSRSIRPVGAGEASEVPLTDEERQFLAGKRLRLGIDRALPPFEFINDRGAYSGISADFIIAAARRLGVEIVPLEDMSWNEALRQIGTGGVDVIPKVTVSPERGRLMTLTRPYCTFPSVIVCRKDHLAGGMDDLRGLRVGVLRGQVVEARLRRDAPDLNLVPYPDLAQALHDLSDAKIDAFVENLGAVSYAIEEHGLSNLRIAGSTPYSHDISFGVRKDWPLLASALDKALESLTDQERLEIKNRWLAVTYEESIDWRVVGPIGAALVIVIVFVMVWNRRLAGAMRARQAALDAARASEAQVQALIAAAPDALLAVDREGLIVMVNAQAERLFGYSRQEMMGQAIEMLVPESIRGRHPALRSGFFEKARTGVITPAPNFTAQAKDGTLIPVDINLSPMETADGMQVIAAVRDVTERKAAEAAVREQEQQLRAIVDNLPSVIILKDRQGKHLMINSYFEKATGVSAASILGRTDAEAMPPAAAAAIMAVDREVMDSGRMRVFEERIPGPGGTARDYLTTKVPLKGEDGAVKGLVVLATDITERKRFEETLAKERAQLKYILDTSPVGVAFSTKGLIHLANPRFQDMFGVGPGEPSPNLYVRPEDRAHLVDRLKAGEIVSNHEVQMYGRDRDVRDMLVTYLPIEHQGEAGILGWLLDITERKLAEETARRAQTEMTQIFNTAGGGMRVIDRDLKVLKVNDAYLKLSGFTREEAESAGCADNFGGDSCRTPDCTLRHILDGEARVERTVTRRRKDGAVIHCDLVATPFLSPEGEILGIIEDFRDVTERVRAEAELKDKMEQLERFGRLTVDRELMMIRLKKEINEILTEQGKAEKYKIVE